MLRVYSALLDEAELDSIAYWSRFLMVYLFAATQNRQEFHSPSRKDKVHDSNENYSHDDVSIMNFLW